MEWKASAAKRFNQFWWSMPRRGVEPSRPTPQETPPLGKGWKRPVRLDRVHRIYRMGFEWLHHRLLFILFILFILSVPLPPPRLNAVLDCGF